MSVLFNNIYSPWSSLLKFYIDNLGTVRLRTSGDLDFSGAIDVDNNALKNAYQSSGFEHVYFPDLETVSGSYAMSNFISGDTNLTSISFPKLETITGSYAMEYLCDGDSYLTSIDFSSLTSVGSYSLQYAFRNCTSLTSADFSNLTSIGQYGMQYAFYNCTNLTDVDL